MRSKLYNYILLCERSSGNAERAHSATKTHVAEHGAELLKMLGNFTSKLELSSDYFFNRVIDGVNFLTHY